MLRLVATDDKTQVIAILLIKVFPRRIVLIAKWSEETTMTVSLNHGDALILLINVAIFSWLQLTALND
ncbi:MAG: hypothetical protein ACLT78_00350 [Escherichia coli]